MALRVLVRRAASYVDRIRKVPSPLTCPSSSPQSSNWSPCPGRRYRLAARPRHRRPRRLPRTRGRRGPGRVVPARTLAPTRRGSILRLPATIPPSSELAAGPIRAASTTKTPTPWRRSSNAAERPQYPASTIATSGRSGSAGTAAFDGGAASHQSGASLKSGAEWSAEAIIRLHGTRHRPPATRDVLGRVANSRTRSSPAGNEQRSAVARAF